MIRSFKNDFQDSCRLCDDFPLTSHFSRYFRGFIDFRPGSVGEDLSGSDYIVRSSYGEFGIDVKVRYEDPQTWGEDDLAIELHSVVEMGIRGYQNKSTTHLMWAFPSTGRSVLIPFDVFKTKYDKSWEYWNFWLREKPQWTELRGIRYQSTHCYVPTSVFGEYVLRVPAESGN